MRMRIAYVYVNCWTHNVVLQQLQSSNSRANTTVAEQNNNECCTTAAAMTIIIINQQTNDNDDDDVMKFLLLLLLRVSVGSGSADGVCLPLPHVLHDHYQLRQLQQQLAQSGSQPNPKTNQTTQATTQQFSGLTTKKGRDPPFSRFRRCHRREWRRRRRRGRRRTTQWKMGVACSTASGVVGDVSFVAAPTTTPKNLCASIVLISAAADHHCLLLLMQSAEEGGGSCAPIHPTHPTASLFYYQKKTDQQLLITPYVYIQYVAPCNDQQCSNQHFFLPTFLSCCYVRACCQPQQKQGSRGLPFSLITAFTAPPPQSPQPQNVMY